MSRRNSPDVHLEEEPQRHGDSIVFFTPYVRRLLIAGFLLWLTTYHTVLTEKLDNQKFAQSKVDNILYTIYGIVGSIVTYELIKWFAD